MQSSAPIPSRLSALNDYSLARASICLICFKAITSKSCAFDLTVNPAMLKQLQAALQLSGTPDMNNERLPQSLHRNCLLNAQHRSDHSSTRVADTRIERAANEEASEAIPASVKRQRSHDSATCILCVEMDALTGAPPKKRKLRRKAPEN